VPRQKRADPPGVGVEARDRVGGVEGSSKPLEDHRLQVGAAIEGEGEQVEHG
jgi:hypothetical protein